MQRVRGPGSIANPHRRCSRRSFEQRGARTSGSRRTDLEADYTSATGAIRSAGLI